MRKSKKKSKVQLEELKDRSGHYDYQNKSKSIFNHKSTRRRRTRQADFEAELEDQYED